uniref:Secreted protein n=1 Tax=Monodon monoceros TaxID=40151 RepID=A0A8C6AVY3_MONMO
MVLPLDLDYLHKPQIFLFFFFFFFCGTQASHCCGLSRCGEQALDAQAQRPWLTGSAAPRHVGSSRIGAQTRVPCVGRWTLNHQGSPQIFLFVKWGQISCIKRDDACEALSIGTYFLLSVSATDMFVLLLCHPGAPRSSRSAATKPEKRRSQGLHGAHGCCWALCWCCFPRTRSVDTQNLSLLHSAGQVGHSPGASGCPGCGFPLCWSQPEALQ